MAVARTKPSPQEKTFLNKLRSSTKARVLGVAMSVAPLSMPVAAQQPTASSTTGGPSFGEEGFGDVEQQGRASTAQESTGAEAESTGQATPEDREATEARRRGDLIRAQAANNQQVAQEVAANGAQKKGGEQITGRIDDAMNMICYELPVVGHFLWFTVKMVVGSWIQEGKGKLIGPMTWSSVALVLSPGGKNPAAKGGGKAVSSMVPDEVSHVVLVVVWLLILINVTLILVWTCIILYVLYRFATDPIGAAVEFGEMFGTLFTSLF